MSCPLAAVEVDETFIGGKERNKHGKKKLDAGRGTIGKAIVVGVKDRATGKVNAEVVSDTGMETLQDFVLGNTEPGAHIYTDEHTSYRGLSNHTTVKHSAGEFVNGMAHTNGVESFWSLLKRGYHGTFHKMSVKHLGRYVSEFAGRHNARSLDTIDQMSAIARGLAGKRLRYRELVWQYKVRPWVAYHSGEKERHGEFGSTRTRKSYQETESSCRTKVEP